MGVSIGGFLGRFSQGISGNHSFVPPFLLINQAVLSRVFELGKVARGIWSTSVPQDIYRAAGGSLLQIVNFILGRF